MPPSPSDSMFGKRPFPSWVGAFRDSQWDAIERIMTEFETKDVVFYDGPTGSGKTLIGETVRRLLDTSCFYTSSTKALQDQFARDFPYANVLKGRANYLTLAGPLDAIGFPQPNGTAHTSFVTCADCTWDGDPKPGQDDCEWCAMRSTCPFQVAKNGAVYSELAVVNNALLLSDPSLVSSGPRGLIIADECDTLESAIMNQVAVELTPRRMHMLGLRPPEKKTVEASWIDWIEYAADVVRGYYQSIPDQDRRPSTLRERKTVKTLLLNLMMLSRELPKGGWVYNYDNKRPDHVVFKPIKIDRYAPDLFWSKGEKFLLMSGSILLPQLMAEDLGLPQVGKEFGYVYSESDFPPENRPVFISPAVSMTRKNKDDAWPKMADAVSAIIRRHPDDRILVHAVSYELASYLDSIVGLSGGNVRDRLVTYTSSGDKDAALERFKESPGAVMLAPSMDRGIDLPGDLCRVQVIVKCPFPNLGDKQIAARSRSGLGGTAWYRLETIRTIMQMVGRAVRSNTDTATTYILDSEFMDNIWKSEFLFPKWWKDALRFDYPYERLVNG